MEIRIEIPKIVYEDSNLERLKRTIKFNYFASMLIVDL